ncbi:MAG: amino acid--tRNA ligase-related protein [Nitrososphaerales archaeon]
MKRIKGWLWDRNILGSTAFLYVRHCDGVMQVVVKKKENESLFEQAVSIPFESPIIVTGEEIETDRITKRYVNPMHEMKLYSLEVVKRAETLPMRTNLEYSDELSIEKGIEQRHLAIKHPKYQSIIEVRSTISKGFREYFDELGYLEVQVPIITPGISEGGAKLFDLSFFGQKASLTQSWQTYGECIVSLRDKVYTIGPAFRAEQSKTKRHLAEFWQGEVEAWLDSFDELLDLEEGVLMHIIEKILNENAKHLRNLSQDSDRNELRNRLEQIKSPFERIIYDEVLKRLPSGHSFNRGDDLGADEERLLTQNLTSPIFVSRYPWAVKPFYAKKDPQDSSMALSADLLAPEGYGEIATGGQREEDYNGLKQNAIEQGLNPDDPNISWYIDLRKYGSSPTFGFGMGIDRLTAWILKLDDIRESTLFPRSSRNRIYQ